MEYGTLSYARRGEAVRQLVLSAGMLTIGRRTDNDLVLDANEISGYHAQIICTDQGCSITDLDSTNGTYLNLIRLEPDTSQPLSDGDIIRIGPYFLRYTQPQIGETTQQQVVPPSAAANIPPSVAAQPTTPTSTLHAGLPVRRLRGSGPPRIPAGRRRLTLEASNYLQYLPPVYHDSHFLGRFLLIFESILSPIERSIDHIHYYFDPQMTPEAILSWLASWVDLVLNENWPLDQRRKLVSAAAELYRWRGTRHGLSEYLRIYTEVDPIIIEAGQEQQYGETTALPPHVFKVILEVPDTNTLDRRFVETIIEMQKPAHTSYVLEIRQQQ